jgi:glutathione synthase/RimK-type ligase-like ATP-grasp enzyme
MCIPGGDRLLGQALEAQGWTVSQRIWSDRHADWSSFDAVVVRSCWDYHLRADLFEVWIEGLEGCGVRMVNSASLIRWNMDKRYLRSLKASGIPVPDTVWVEEGGSCDVADVCAERGWLCAVVKPMISASAYRTSLRRSGLVYGPMMVQEFLPEIGTSGEWSLMFFGGVFSHAVQKIPARGDFRVQHEFGGSAQGRMPSRELIAFGANTIARGPEIPVLARVDIVETAKYGPLLMELEVIEPELFLDSYSGSERLACEAIVSALPF